MRRNRPGISGLFVNARSLSLGGCVAGALFASALALGCGEDATTTRDVVTVDTLPVPAGSGAGEMFEARYADGGMRMMGVPEVVILELERMGDA